jgi:hypothetical protein
MTEIDLAAQIIKWLKDRDWIVHQEVLIPGVKGPADIVAVKDGMVWFIETKLSLNLDLLGQAYRWLGMAHRVSMGLPYPKRGEYDKKMFVGQFCSDYGISTIKVDHRGKLHFHHLRAERAPVEQAAIDFVMANLCEEQKTYAPAGGRGNKIWTPYKSTCQIVVKHVQDHPGCTIAELVETCGRLHYSSNACARSTLLKRIAHGAVKGVTMIQHGSDYHLFPEVMTPAS